MIPGRYFLEEVEFHPLVSGVEEGVYPFLGGKFRYLKTRDQLLVAYEEYQEVLTETVYPDGFQWVRDDGGLNVTLQGEEVLVPLWIRIFDEESRELLDEYALSVPFEDEMTFPLPQVEGYQYVSGYNATQVWSLVEKGRELNSHREEPLSPNLKKAAFLTFLKTMQHHRVDLVEGPYKVTLIYRKVG